MSVQPEISNWDATILQWDATTPAQGGAGGAANAPLLSLANRSQWLKAQLASQGSEIAQLAALNSPAFTGLPTAPTQAPGDNSQNLATTAWATRMYSGEGTIAVTSPAMTVTAAQMGVGIVKFTGALTANSTVTLPDVGRWVIINGTTGAFTLTLAGVGSGGGTWSIAQGYSREVWSDAFGNVKPVDTDYTSVALTGTPTAPTQAPGDNSTKVASTAFVATAVANVTAALASVAGTSVSTAAATTLTAANFGGVCYCTGTGTFNVTVPAADQSGRSLTFVSLSENTVNATAAAGVTIYGFSSAGADPGQASPVPVSAGLGGVLELRSVGTNWVIVTSTVGTTPPTGGGGGTAGDGGGG